MESDLWTSSIKGLGGSTMKRKAFTLIELLVVIAIIAILAGILFPVFNRARDAAKGVKDQAAIKQLTMGYIMYAQENDDYLPMGYSYDANATPQYVAGIAQALPYYKEKSLLKSGFNPWKDTYYINDKNTSWTGLYWTSYAVPLSVAWAQYSRNLSAPQSPSSTVMFIQSMQLSGTWQTTSPDTWNLRAVNNTSWYVSPTCASHPWDNVYDCNGRATDAYKPWPSRGKDTLFSGFDGSARSKPNSVLVGDLTTPYEEGDANNFFDMQ